MDSTKRSIAKTISWRLTGTGATFGISYLVSGSFGLASTIAVIQLTANTILYFAHERIWNTIKWGQNQ